MCQTTRRCSYCRETGHMVHQCNSEDLINLKRMCFCQRIIFDYGENSQADFQQWFTEVSRISPRMVVAFTSRFCNVPTRIDFVERMEEVSKYIYTFPSNELLNEANPENNPWTNLALTNLMTLRNMTWFTDRIDYIMEIIHFTNTKLKQNILADIILEKTGIENNDETCSECSICYENKKITQYARLNCGHSFCGDCIIQTMKTTHSRQISCSLCRTLVTQMVVIDDEVEVKMKKHLCTTS